MSKGELSDHAGVVIHPPLLLVLCLAVAVLASRFHSLTFLLPILSAVVGPVLTVGSLGLATWAMLTMWKAGASIPPNQPTDAIVVAGPFRYSRNPIYLSMLLLQIAIGFWVNSFWFIALAAIFAAAISWGVIAREEQYLNRKFGSEYASYRLRVRRWI